jgi:DNA-binding SARP family transcriptional activator
MIALSQMIHFHIYVDGQHNKGRDVHSALEALYSTHRNMCDAVSQMRFSSAISAGYCFFSFDVGKIDVYSLEAMLLAKDLDLPNYLAAIKLTDCYRYAYVGDWNNCEQVIADLLPFLESPRVVTENKLGIMMVQASVLVMQGDFVNYQHKKYWLLDASGSDVSLSVIPQFLAIYDIVMHIAHEKYAWARTSVRKGLEAWGPGCTPHLQSQLWQYKALLEAIGGNRDAALSAARESRRQRLVVGSGRYDAINLLVLGIVYLLLDDFDGADKHFDCAHTTIITLGDEHLLASLRMNRAYMYLLCGQKEKARFELVNALAQMKKNGYLFFFGWVPVVMKTVLSAAVKFGIEVEFVRRLGRERMGLTWDINGVVQPILFARVMGEFSLHIDRKKIIHESDLSPLQRSMIALILISPGYYLPQQEVQEALWPDAAPEKSRSSFDTLLSRMRKTLNARLSHSLERNYLQLQKGLLKLEHTDCDLHRFRCLANQALDASQKGQRWRAENFCYRAMQVWQGMPFSMLAVREYVESTRIDIERLYLKIVKMWSSILSDYQRPYEAIELLEQALEVVPIDQDLVKKLYHLYVLTKKPIQAARTVEHYRHALQRDGFAIYDIEDALDCLWVG